MVTVAKAQQEFNDLLERAVKDKERVVLTRNGKRLAALVPIEDLDLIEEIEAIEDRIDIEEAAKARADYEKHGGIPWETLKKELNL
ncbi:MAG: type II toxin-antitoxin system prevent-host-death family antitoxin [Dehalococcoidia bacterium]